MSHISSLFRNITLLTLVAVAIASCGPHIIDNRYDIRVSGRPYLGNPLNFSSTITPPQGLYWEFGDGAISTDVAPSHYYTQPGYYTVLLKVAGNIVATEPLAVGPRESDIANYIGSHQWHHGYFSQTVGSVVDSSLSDTVMEIAYPTILTARVGPDTLDYVSSNDTTILYRHEYYDGQYAKKYNELWLYPVSDRAIYTRILRKNIDTAYIDTFIAK